MNNLEIAVFRLAEKFIPNNGNFNRGLSLTPNDVVFIPRKDGAGFDTKRICYNRNYSSIFVDDWNVTDPTTLESIIKKTPKIEWGKQPEKYADPKKYKNLKAFLELSNQNGSNPHRDTNVEIMYYSEDRRAEAEDNVRLDKTETLAKAQAYDGDIEKLREVMSLMGMFPTNKHGEPWTENQVRDAALQEINKGRDTEFLDIWNSPNLQYRVNINKAIQTGVIYLDENNGEIKWGDNHNPIKTGTLPYGRDWKDFLVQFVANGGKGKSFYDQLLINLSGGMSADELSSKFGGANASRIEEMTPSELADKAIEFGIIVRKTPYLYIEGMYDASERICKSKDDLVVAIKDNNKIGSLELGDYVKKSLKIRLA